MDKRVIDISYFNDVFDWDAVKQAVDAVIIRAGYRGCSSGRIVQDTKAADFVRACQKYGIPFSIYFFPTSVTNEEADEEAEWIIHFCRQYGIEPCLPVYLDSEKVTGSGRSDNISRGLRTRMLNRIMSGLKAAGYRYGVYASTSWYAERLNDSELLQGCSRWVAQYASRCTYKGEIDLWQYTSSEYVPGIRIDGDKRCDVSKCYISLEGGKQADKAADDKLSSGKDLAEHIVQTAKSFLGCREADGSHRKIIDIYNKYLSTAVKSGTVDYRVSFTDAWCATFVSAVFISAGLASLCPVECSCPRMISLAQKKGIWIEDEAVVPEKGWIIMYDWQDQTGGAGDDKGTADHVGIVTAVSGRQITVIEGNKEDKVGYRSLAVNGRYIRGYIAPAYGEGKENKKEESKEEKKAVLEPASRQTYAVSGNGVPSKSVQYHAAVSTRSDPLNVRLGPGTSFGLCRTFGPIPRGSQVDVCDAIQGPDGRAWAYVRYQDKYGYVSMQYLARV